MGTAFRVNTYQANWQRDPDVIAMQDGGFLITYESYVNGYDDGPSATVVMSRRYDASGQPVGPEELVDGVDGSWSANAQATLLSDGGYAVTWLYDGSDDIISNDEQVYVRAYDADGTPRTEAIRVDEVNGDGGILPEVFATEDGGFRVVFGMGGTGSRFDELYAQRFDVGGARIGGNEWVNVAETEFDQFLARSATLEGGSTITIWNSESTFDTDATLDSNELRAAITGPTGETVRSDFHLAVNLGTIDEGYGVTGLGYDVAALRDGGFAVVHLDYDWKLGLDTEDAPYYTLLRLFDADGRERGGPAVVLANDDRPDLVRAVQLDTGQIVVVWDQDDDTPGFYGDVIRGRVFSEDGRSHTDQFDVSPAVPNHFEQYGPAIAALPGGRFVVTWTSEYVDDDHDGVAGRIFGYGAAGDDLGPMGPADALPRPGGDAPGGGGGGGGMGADLSGDDHLRGGGGRDVLAGGAGDDTLIGRGGDDRLLGGPGEDRLLGGGGGDVLIGGAGDDALRGGGGDDLLRGGGGADRLFGGGGADVLAGGGGADLLRGQAGADVLRGQGGADVLHGGAGRDVLAGGGGADRFVFARGDGVDRITDFRRLDTLAIDGDLVGRDVPGTVLRLAGERGDDVVLRFGDGDVLVIEDASIADLRGNVDIF